jgi:hypothetical protein
MLLGFEIGQRWSEAVMNSWGSYFVSVPQEGKIMPVSGKELASLDFANLIGGPLNAIVEAQAKSAISTANFVKEVGFDKEGKAVNVDFSYNRKNDDGGDQEFTLSLPFITMLPVPYITVKNAVIDFNAKITSTTQSSVASNFKQQVDASAGGSFWFGSAKVNTKTSYQRTSASSDKEERTFDMHVRVEAGNQDMPAGTERILTLLENSIQEKTSYKLLTCGVVVTAIDSTNNKITVDGGDLSSITKTQDTFEYAGKTYTVSDYTEAVAAKAADSSVTPNVLAVAAQPATITLDIAPSEGMINKSIDIKLSN